MPAAFARSMALGLIATVLAACGGTAHVSGAAPGSCTTSAQYGTCSYPPYQVNQNVWNRTARSTQTLTARSAAQWRVSTFEPAGSSVRAYPNVGESLGQPISDYTQVVATFADTMPTGGREEAAFDIWVNGAPGTSSTAHMIEVMVWTSTHRTMPSGGPVTTATIGGQAFTVWECQASGCAGHPYYAFVLTGNESSGRVNILAFLHWLISRGLVPASDPLTQVQDGWEIASTGGSTETFSMTNYQLRVALRG
jgi:Glycosyl hydrolase family 12